MAGNGACGHMLKVDDLKVSSSHSLIFSLFSLVGVNGSGLVGTGPVYVWDIDNHHMIYLLSVLLFLVHL